MTNYLITPSLLNSFAWYLQNEKDSARDEFLSVLKKEKLPPTEAMQKGIDFERHVQDFYKHDFMAPDLKSLPPEYWTCVGEFAGKTLQGTWQLSCKKELTIFDQTFLLYGRCDVVKKDTIYDIKFTKNYEAGKFYNSAQHLIYLYCLNLPKFSYLICDGKDCYEEDYTLTNNTESVIISKISDFMYYLEHDIEAGDLFELNWKSKI